MKFKRNLLKKKAVTIGAVLLSLPLLFGFKAESADTVSDDKSSLSAQTSDEAVDTPFKGNINSTEEKVTAEENPDATSNVEEEKTVLPPRRIEYDERMLRNEAEYKQYLDQFEGRTVVDVKFEGASASTLSAVA